jgi:ATP-dependent helicase/nuclease subunit A
VDIRRIVAMTFTRKAAAEMLERAAGRLDRLFDAATQPEQLHALRTLRERLIGAQVSTFHSYCSTLLRRFPIEADIPPTFGELSQADSLALKRDAIRASVERWLATSDRRADLAELLNVFGSYASLERVLVDLLGRVQRFDAIERSIEWQTYDERIRAVLSTIIAEQRRLWQELNHRANHAPLPPRTKPPSPKAEEILARLQRECTTLHQLNELDAPWRTTLDEALALFHGTSSQSTLRSPWNKVATVHEVRQANRVASVLRSVLESTPEVEQRAWNAVQLLVALARESRDRIDDEKTLLAAFEPDDLQRRALELLGITSVRDRLRWEIEHVLVDEFQDTDPIQYDVLQQLIPLPEQQADMPELFIVGDPKQSIYGFRGADVRVFERARHDIVAAAGADADVHLQTSFRMTPTLVAVVNTVMQSVMPSQTVGYAVGYEELCTARLPQTCPQSTVAMLVAHSEELPEADLVARHIVHITSVNPLPVWDEHLPVGESERGGFRPAQYRDIALLARKSRTFEHYVRSLRAAGIPFRIESGRGFYQTQEVLDVLAFLRVVHNRHDDVAFASLLRSPFIGLDDSDLACIALSPPRHGSLAERFGEYARRSDSSRIRAAAALLDELLPIAVRMPPTALIRLLLRRTPWYARVRTSPRALQIEANIEKLLDAAREFEQRGFRNLLDFVEELEQLRLVADTESEAAVISDENVVTLMTIHAAKGLEFPIVYLVGADESTRRSGELVITTDELGVSIATVGNGQATAAGALARHLAHQRDEAEQQRLLYVALTRAKDHLLIAGTLSNTGEDASLRQPSGYLGDISAALGIDWSTSASAGIRSHTIRSVVRSDPNEAGEQVDVTIELIYTLPPARAQQPSASQLPRPLRTELVESATSGEIISATQLMLFEQSPKEFFRIYRCGLPATEDDERRALAPIDDADQVVGTLAGRIIHRALELVLQSRRDDSATIAAAIDRSLSEFHCMHLAQVRERAEQDVVATVEYLRQAQLLGRHAHFIAEQPLMMPIGEDFLLGVPDVFIQTTSGWEVWDWKTNRHDRRTAREWLEYYRTQLEVYVVLIASWAPEQEEFTARLIMTRPPVDTVHIRVRRADLPAITDRISGLIERIKETSVRGKLR